MELWCPLDLEYGTFLSLFSANFNKHPFTIDKIAKIK